jgi:hypothetical protein
MKEGGRADHDRVRISDRIAGNSKRMAGRGEGEAMYRRQSHRQKIKGEGVARGPRRGERIVEGEGVYGRDDSTLIRRVGPPNGSLQKNASGRDGLEFGSVFGNEFRIRALIPIPQFHA